MEADAEAGFVKNFVGVFGVDPVFDGAGAGEGEAGGRELDDIGEGYLRKGLVVSFFFLRCECVVAVYTYQDVHVGVIFLIVNDCGRVDRIFQRGGLRDFLVDAFVCDFSIAFCQVAIFMWVKE